MLVTKGPAFDSPWYMDQHTRMEASERSVLLDVLFILLVLIIPRWADQIIHQQLSCPLPRLFCSNKGKIDFPDWLARWKSFESLWWTTNFAMTSHLAKPLMHVAHPSIYPSSPIYQHTRQDKHTSGRLCESAFESHKGYWNKQYFTNLWNIWLWKEIWRSFP